jgi:hypothetical protein
MATAKKAPSQAVAARKENAGALAQRSSLAEAMAADAGKGFEEAGRDAFAIPFLRILQDLSPQVKKTKTEYIKGAEAGMIFNTVTQQLYQKVHVIPCHYSQSFIEWVPRSKGGGLVAVHTPEALIVRQASRVEGRLILPNGHELADTRSHFVLLVNEDGSTEGALIAMSSSGMKVSKRWMTQMRTSTAPTADWPRGRPMFSWVYELGVEEESNDKGSWYTWTVGERRPVEDLEQYQAAKSFFDSMKAGNVRVNYEELQPTAAGGSDGSVPGDLSEGEIDA